MAMDRLNVLGKHLITPLPEEWGIATRVVGSRDSPRFANSPDDIVVVQALRTALGKSKRGSFKDTHQDDLLSAVFTAVLKSTNLPPEAVGDICVGNVNDPRAAFTVRTAQFFSGIPETVPYSSTNRQCGSGLQAFMNIAGGIKTKSYDIGLAGGFESMSKNALGSNKGQFADLNPKVADYKLARDSLIPMGITSENVAERFGITRLQQDQFAVDSHKKAARAAEMGLFNAEIVPVETTILDKDGNERKIVVTKDDGFRANTTVEILAKLRPAFKEGGSTTAGNASQTTDGAAAVLVASRAAAGRERLGVLGTLRGFAVVGCPPDIMGIGPAVAIPEVLKKTGLSIDDIDIFEINEAFASQAYYCVKKLGIPMEKVNPKGGAIAIGHPLGCTGSRQIATLLHEMKRRGKRSLGIVSMCMGTGMGAAAVFEYNP